MKNAKQENSTRFIYRKVDRRTILKAGLALAASGLFPKNVFATEPQGPFDVIVIGGGLAGLAAAHKLKDLNILVLEKENIPGGRTISGRWRNFSYAKGTEYMGPPEADLMDLFKGLGIKPTPIAPPVDAVARGGKMYIGKNYLGFLESEAAENDYWRLMELLEAVNAKGIEEGLANPLETLRQFGDLDGLTVEAWMKKNAVNKGVQQLVDVENRGLFGANNRELSMLFNIPEMSWNMTDPEEESKNEVFAFPNGMAEIVQALTRSLGPRLLTGAEVTSLSGRGEGVSVTYKKNGATHTVEADCAVVASPAAVTSKVLKSGIRKPVIEALGSIKYAPYATLNLFLKKRLWKDAWAASCLDTFFVTIYDAVRLQVKPDYDGECVLGVYIAPEHQADPYLLKAPEKEILSRSLQDLKSWFPDIENQLAGYDLHRFKYAFPVFRPGYLDALETLHRDESAQGPIILAGDYMVYATVDGAVRSGYRAARLAREWLEE